MQFTKLALVVLLALFTTACGYTWRPLNEARLARRPDLGAVVLFTGRGSIALEDAKESASGIEGKSDGGPVMVPRSEIRGGMVYEPVWERKRQASGPPAPTSPPGRGPLSAGEIAGIVVAVTVPVILIAVLGGLSCGLSGINNWSSLI
jgi:hypothetical protein